MSIFKTIETLLLKFFVAIGLKPGYYELVNVIILFLLLVICGWVIDFIIRKIIITTVVQLTKKTETLWDDILVEKKVFHQIARLSPFLLFYFAAPLAFYKYLDAAHIIQTLAKSCIVFIIARIFDAFLNAAHSIYELNPNSKQKPIKGYIQVCKIIIYFVCTLVILSIIFDKSLIYFFSGLGALAAVLQIGRAHV